MTIVSGPKIVDDGLIFHYDMGNASKSFKGKPTTNLNSEDIPDLEQIGPPTLTQYSSPTPIGTTAYTVTDSSTSNYQYIRRLGVATIPNDTSTYYLSLYIRKQAGAERFGINWGFDGGGTPISNNSRFNTKTGVASGSGTAGGSVVDLGEWWRWIVTSSNNATGNTSLNVSIYPAAGQNGSDDPTATGTVVISALQVETGSFATPYVSGTRSNTQAIVDLTGNNTITATSLTYNSDGTFSFDGSSNHLSFNLPASYTNYSIEYWVKMDTVSVQQRWFSNGNTGTFTLYYNGGWAFHFNPLAGTPPSITTGNVGSSATSVGVWNHVVATNDQSNSTTGAKCYVNGAFLGSAIPAVSLASGGNKIGSREGTTNFGDGQCAIARIYNRVLSAAEVAQNFNASRTRFGI